MHGDLYIDGIPS